jgi:hypothetical protein
MLQLIWCDFYRPWAVGGILKKQAFFRVCEFLSRRFNIVQKRTRNGLARQGENIPNQIGEATKNPILLWLSQISEIPTKRKLLWIMRTY